MFTGGKVNWTLTLLAVSWLAAFSSQSLIDVVDSLVIGTAFFKAYKKNELIELFKGFSAAWLWPIWILIILIGLFLNFELNSFKAWEDFLEFRWILTFLSWIYLLSRISPNPKIFNYLGLLVLVLNIVAFGIWLRDPTARAGGLLGTSMAFAHNIAPIFCFYTISTLVEWKNRILREKILIALVSVTSGAMVILTFTRGMWIGSVGALVLCAFIWNRKAFATVLATLILIFVIGITTSERFYNRVFTKSAGEIASNQERTALWRANWEMIKEYPVFGVGLGANKSHLRKHYDKFGYPADQRQSHAHNQFLQYWAGTGTLGLACFLIFLYIVLRDSYKSYSKSNDTYLSGLQLALFSSLVCFLIGSLTESNFNIAKNRFLFLFLAAMAVAWAGHNTQYSNRKKSSGNKD